MEQTILFFTVCVIAIVKIVKPQTVLQVKESPTGKSFNSSSIGSEGWKEIPLSITVAQENDIYKVKNILSTSQSGINKKDPKGYTA